MVRRSVREGGDTKTRKSRRSLALPQRCIDALKAHQTKLAFMRRLAANRWQENDLVFASAVGTELNARNVRRAFRKVVQMVGLAETDWTPPELRHSFVSLLSDSGMPIVEHGAEAMDRIFRGPDDDQAAAST